MKNPDRSRKTALAAPLAVMLVWCGDTHLAFSAAAESTQKMTPTALPPASQVNSLRLVPQQPTLWGAQASQRFLMLATYEDGLERDVSSESEWNLSTLDVAQLETGVTLLALSNGEVDLIGSFAGHTARTRVRIQGIEENRPFGFARDIGGIFTKKGCNSSDCHGGVKGQGGFKLSVNALFPKDDYHWIVQGGTYEVMTAESDEPKTPRVHLQEPEQSLLLQKATAAVQHGGGQRFSQDSTDYRTLLNWIQSGAPYGAEDGEKAVRIERLEIVPAEAVLDSQGCRQLLVNAHLSNGRREDITDQVLYESNDYEVLDVSEDGLVSAKQIGETAIMVRAAGHAASARFGVIAESVADFPEVEPRNLIDEHVFAKLRKFNILPSHLSSDGEFLRRACLDVTGTLPPPERVREFLSDQDPRKRNQLIEILLHSPEYVEYWTYRFSKLFRVYSGATLNVEHAQRYEDWIRRNIAQNRPYDQLARERLTAQGFEPASSHYWTFRDLTPVEAITTEQVRVFWGRRLGCAQCHNHPFENWSQDQFWGLAAFFGNMTRVRDVTQVRGPYFVIDDPAGHGKRKDGSPAKLMHPRTKEVVTPRFLDGTELAEEQQGDPRKPLAEWMVASPYFSQAIVNRIWSQFFGRGIVDPVDDFRSTNPPTHPELLEKLAADFVTHGYDLQHLMRRILQSRTYQLSARPNGNNGKDRINYSRSQPRLLEAPVLLDTISQVTGLDSELIVREGEDASSGAPPGTRAIQLLPTLIPSRFFEVYGRNDRRGIPDRGPEPTLLQSLHRLAGPTYTTRLAGEGSRVERLMLKGLTDRQIIEDLYLSAFSRFPTEGEIVELQWMISQRFPRLEGYESLIWALISSREFVYNH